MPTNPVLIGALVLGAILLLRSGNQAGGAATFPFGGFGSMFGGAPFRTSTAEILAASADEDIGIPPQGPLADPAPTNTGINTGPASDPVASQDPINVVLTGSFDEGFNLVGDTAGLTGATPIFVSGTEGVFNNLGIEGFHTTPDVFARSLQEFFGPVGGAPVEAPAQEPEPIESQFQPLTLPGGQQL